MNKMRDSTQFFFRGGLVRVCGVVAMLVCLAWPCAADDANIRVETFTYKKIGELEIKADLHRADDEEIRPVVVWIHGGALINGHRAGVGRRVRTMVLNEGYALVSIDYRLAPETKLPAIIEDIEDAFRWLRQEGRRRLRVDTSRIAVMGGSAGGYLTLTAGYRVEPRPAVLISFWGYGDLVGPWYSRPSQHPRHHRIKLTREEAHEQVSGPPIADSRERPGNGGAFYQYCRQTGLWPKAVSGWDPDRETEQFYPYMPVQNVTAEYPPTLLIHGTEDTDVPYEQSAMMAQQFKEHGVEHRLITVPGGEHGLGGGDPNRIDAAYQSALDFMKRHTLEK
jgi:acetyl esterase/lipase